MWLNKDTRETAIAKKETIKMGNEKLNLENRIELLRGRTGRENGSIIKKLQRRLRRLTSN